MSAYAVRADQISAPAWLDDERYDVVATIPPRVSNDQISVMLQQLLFERFRLMLHWDAKDRRVYVLEVDKDGPKMKSSKLSDKTDSESDVSRPREFSFSNTGEVEFIGTTMAAFSNLLTALLDRPVIDMTGLQGMFDITLNVSMEEFIGLQRNVAAAVRGDSDAGVGQGLAISGSSSASIVTAVRKLGLVLRSQKRPIKHLIVDSAEKTPIEN